MDVTIDSIHEYLYVAYYTKDFSRVHFDGSSKEAIFRNGKFSLCDIGSNNHYTVTEESRDLPLRAAS